MFVSLVLLINAKDRLMQKEKEIAKEAVEEAFCLGDEEDGDAVADDDKESDEPPKPKSRGAFYFLCELVEYV